VISGLIFVDVENMQANRRAPMRCGFERVQAA